MLESISQFAELQTAQMQFHDPLYGFMVHAKQIHPHQILELLSGSVSLDRMTFDREILHLEARTLS
jgi:hypothetical protein